MFQWNYASVARECEDFIGPAGYGFVEGILAPFLYLTQLMAHQVGNNVEHITGSSWWTSYQVVSYKVGSKFGDQAAFEDMCRRCRAVGVGVLVDVIVNHMTGTLGPNIGTSGTRKFEFFSSKLGSSKGLSKGYGTFKEPLTPFNPEYLLSRPLRLSPNLQLNAFP